MISTIEDARKYEMTIRREVRFFAIDEAGNQYQLFHDWRLEEINKKLDKMETNQ